MKKGIHQRGMKNIFKKKEGAPVWFKSRNSLFPYYY